MKKLFLVITLIFSQNVVIHSQFSKHLAISEVNLDANNQEWYQRYDEGGKLLEDREY